ncbi:MAG: peptidylprolyl isomerase [Mariniblastus sp.]|nr:peptidylprolyl isomerase [Mariniblastus sp.]
MHNPILKAPLARTCPVLLLLLLSPLLGSPLYGQGTRQDLDREIAEWRQILLEAREARIRYSEAEREESVDLRETYGDLIKRGNQKMEILIPMALASLNESSEPDEDLVDFVTRIQNKYFADGEYDRSYALGQQLLEIDSDNRIAKLINGRLSVLTNRFDDASTFIAENRETLKDPQSGKSYLNSTEENLYADLPQLTKKYQRELAIQEKEKGDNLPQVELRTTKGTIVLELFENQAPDTVGNFISLLESGFYAETFFHRVVPQFMVQGGGFTKTARGKTVPKFPGYFIYDEIHPTENREHFRGVISMANTGEPNTGNSQFFITTVPTPHLDGNHTVFGRVISGMDVVDTLNVTVSKENDEGVEVEIPGVVQDKILSTRVIRKQDHDYKPKKIE